MVSRSRAVEIGAVTALLALLAVQAIASMRLKSCTSDEVSHLPSGYSYVVTGDFRLNPEHPPLVKELAGLSLLLLRPELDLDHPGWRADPPDQWSFGRDFLYSHDADRLLFWGRLPTVLLALVLGVYVFLWTRRLWGWQAGLAALALYVTCPAILGHARWVTMDMAQSCFVLACVFHLWRFQRTGAVGHAAGVGITMGLALASKYTGVLLLPIVGLLVLLGWLRAAREEEPAAVRRRVLREAVAVASILLVASLITWASFGFPGDPMFYVDGMAKVNENHQSGYWYYLLGEFRQNGWWWYFLAALAVKTRGVVLVLAVLALVLAATGRLPRAKWADELTLLLPPLVWLVVISAMADNLGVRYVLPLYGFLFVSLGRLTQLVTAARWRQVLAAGVAVWVVAGAAVAYPHYLSYFNEFVGGSAQGYRYLDDSNLDWGQDLKGLAPLMEERGIERVELAYNWGASADPTYYGIAHDPMSGEDMATAPPPPGVYAVSTAVLIQGAFLEQTHGVPTDWLARYEPIDHVGYSIYLFEFE